MPSPLPRSTRSGLALGVGFLGLLTAGLLGGNLWLRSYLHGPDFQRFVASRLGSTLHAEVECLPFRFDGLTLYCDGIKAHGYEGASFSQAELTQVRAHFHLRGALKGAWTIDQLHADALKVQLDGSRLALPPSAPRETRTELKQPTEHGLTPSRLEIAAGDVSSIDFSWGESPEHPGSFRQAGPLRFRHTNGAVWQVDLAGGDLVSAGLPPLRLEQAQLQYRQKDDTLVVEKATFTGIGGGNAIAAGDVQFGRQLDLQAHVTDLDLAPMLSGDWRLRLHGRMTGDLHVQSALPVTTEPSLSGAIQITEGRLEALPLLNQIAAFTRSQQLRQIPLTRASADFDQRPGHLRLTKLVAESEGALRLEGDVAVDGSQVEGTLQVGLPPALVQWVPGARERVFTTSRDGYVWAPMHVTGPVDSPNEDLSQRLITAAGETVIDKVDAVSNEAIQRAKEAAKGVLDQLLPLVK